MPALPRPSRSTCRPLLQTAIAIALGAGFAATANAAVHLRSRTIDATAALRPDSVAALPSGPSVYVVAARDGVTPVLRARIAAAGANVLTYLPDQAVAIWADRDAVGRLLPIDAIAFVAHLDPADRLAPELRQLPAADPILLEIAIVPQIAAAAAATPLSDLGLEVLGVGPARGMNRVVARLPAGRADLLNAATTVGGVFWINRRPSYRLLNDTSIWVGQTGLSGGGLTPLYDHGLHGEGEIAAVLDTGLDLDMCFFADPAGTPPVNTVVTSTATNPALRKVIAYDMLWSADRPTRNDDYDDHGHGTHVAGSVLGDNFANLNAHDPADGMAPAAKLVVQDGGYRIDDCADLPALGCPVIDLTPIFDQAYVQGARLHNNSWGDRENSSPNNTYTNACVDADDFMWRHRDFLIVFAAGNSGSADNTVGSPSTAKNVIAVGATRRGAEADQLTGFSSRGWAADGRIKPTVSCPGNGIISADSDNDITTDNCSTTSMSGTSMASPTCVGLGLLARQYFTAGYYPSGTARVGDRFTPTAALVKATLINSGRDMNAEAPPIARGQGFGRVTLADTLRVPGSGHDLLVFDDPIRFPAGSTGSWTVDVEVMSASLPLKATLVWTDYPSTPAAATNLVNDLDLVVSGPSGTYFGNVYGGAGVSTTGGTADRRNVEEQVHIAAPSPGLYRIEIRAANIIEGPQGFALVVRGDLPAPPGVAFGGLDGTIDDLASCTDRDGSPDNGETVRVSIVVKNDGRTPATNVAVSLTTASPYLTLAGPNPVLLGTVPPGTAIATFDLAVDGAPCATPALLEFVVTSTENAWPETGAMALTLEEDLVVTAITTLGFEGGFVDSNGDAWTRAGGFVASTNRAASGTAAAWAGIAPAAGHCDGSGSRDGANQCATLTSPIVRAMPTSRFTLSTWYSTEDPAGQVFDRANVHVIDGPIHTLLTPTAGRPYDGGTGDNTALCHLSGEAGWAGDGTSWATSTFDLGPFAGRDIRVEISHNTDGAEICEGLYVDDLRLENVRRHACDSRVCGACAIGSLGPLTQLLGVRLPPLAATFTWSDPGTGASEYHLNSVVAKTSIPTPRLGTFGDGTLECSSSSLGCTDGDAFAGPPDLLYYQSLAACGASGADEGPP